MEPLTAPGEARDDPEGNGNAPEVDVGGEETVVNDETLSTNNEIPTATTAEDQELTEAIPKDQIELASDPNEAMTETSINSELEISASASPIIETSAKATPEGTKEESPPNDNNSHSESEPTNRPRIDTPDFSMGIYSMDLPPTTPQVQLNDELDLKTPKRASSPALEVKSSEGESSTSASPNDTTRALHETTPLQSNGFNNLSTTQQTPISLFHAVTEESSLHTTNATTPSVKKAGATSKTLAALFGGPSIGSAPGDYSSANLNNLAAQHDYTLVGDSPYETTYDPQSAFYYNRVYGQLYITTISVMFRGKAFGPIGAIPYERRLLLPFLEVSEIHPYKTTSVKITMNDSESYVFKGFADREAMVKLLRRTKRKCNEMYKQRRHTTSIVPATMSVMKPSSEASVHANTKSTPNHGSHVATPSNNALLHPPETNEKQHRRSRTPNSVKSKHSKHSDLRRRSQSMPSSLREAKAARAPSKSASATPQRNSVFFDDETIGNKENSGTSETKTPATRSKPVTVGSLRLSLQDDDNGRAEENEMNRPRRLFEVEPNAMLAANATAAAVMLSPPRTRISQRKQPKTPQVASANETLNNKSTLNAAKNNDPSRQAESSRKNTMGGTLASIPSIPTVPSLNTPDFSSQRKIIKLEASRVARGKAIPVPIPEMANDDTSPPNAKSNSTFVGVAPRVMAPVTPIAKHSPAPTPQDIMLEKSWKTERIATNTKEWTVAMEPTTLPNCTLDEWFELFFSNDAFFSLARYQLEHVGDRDVSFHPWRQQQSKKSPEEKKSESRGYEPEIPELEREIRYIHPIDGGMIGPSEAETFRIQSMKRYKHHGIILKNVTTVGKGIPMGDCFRVEDQWNIENHPTECALTISVSFRVVFVKRTMFKSVIQKNTLAETKEWFKGYSKMMTSALKSAKHQELIQRRQSYSLVQEVADSSPAISSTSSMRESSAKSHRELASDALSTSPQSRHATDNSLATQEDSKPTPLQSSGNTTLVLLGIGLILLLLGALVALWLQVRSVTTSLSMVEGALGDLQAQNALLLQKLEELGQPIVERIDAASTATVSSAIYSTTT